ncbi:hypothetical protein C810_01468 [Lachnospiraceae bacterium A2]|nr:hypothetical protein C810_01468 [Lachnospiraceae bacterium A2]
MNFGNIVFLIGGFAIGWVIGWSVSFAISKIKSRKRK